MLGEDRRPKRRIAIFLRSLEGGGGAERVMLNLARAFADQGHQVDLVMARLTGRFLEDLPENVHIVDLGVRSALPLLRAFPRLSGGDVRALLPFVLSPQGPRVLGAVPALARHLSARHPDILLCGLNYPNVAGVVAKQLSGLDLPAVITIHNHLSTQIANSRRGRERRLPLVVRRFFPRASAAVAVSGGVAADAGALMGTGPGSVETIHNPVIDERLSVLAREPSGEPWLEEVGPPVVLGAGKLKPQKDFATLLRAFARLRRERPARLIILGEGPEEARLKALAGELGVSDDVRFPGFVANPYAYMARAEVFALSSAWEGFGNVVAEALACGTPVVATDCPSGPAEILADGGYGRLVPVGDDGAMAEALAAALDEPGDAAARRRRGQDFSIETAAGRYLELFERLLSERAHR